jgi:hypothetical protein
MNSSSVIAPVLYADFQNADAQGRIRLNSAGTRSDLALQQTQLSEGQNVRLYADDLDADGQYDRIFVDGRVSWSADEGIWVATIDWSAVRHVSELLSSIPWPPAAPFSATSSTTAGN